MAKSKVAKGKSLLSFFVPALGIGALLVLLAAAAFYFFGYQQPLKEQASFYLQSSVDEKAQQVSSKIAQLEADIKQTIETSAQESEMLANLKTKYPSVTSVTSYDPDNLAVNMDASPAVTHVTLELLSKVAQNGQAKPELILKNSQPDYVAFVASANDKAYLIAVEPNQLAQVFGSVQGPIELQLLQHFDEGSHLISSSKGSSASTAAPLAESQKFGANWSVAVHQDANAFSPNFMLPLLLLLAAIGGLVIASILPYLGLNKTLKSEARSFIKGISSNRMPSNYKVNFFNELAASYRRVHQTEEVEAAPVDLMEEEEVPSGEPVEEDKFDVDLLQIAEKINPEIFREYDVRGEVGKTLNEEIVYALGRAIGSEAYARGEQKVLVARDGRISSPQLHQALVQGLLSSGRDIIDLGMVPTPIMYFATGALNVRSGVMLTGSHNPPQHNGLKIVLAGETLYGRDIKGLLNRIKDNDFLSGKGRKKELDFEQSYLEKVVSDINLEKPLKVAVDCGNGVTGNILPRLLQALGCEVIALHTEIDGHFPNHHPDPNKAKNLQDLIEMVKSEQADLGIAFDGDGDRLGVVDSSGKIIWTDRVMMLLAADVLSRNHGAEILFDVKCSRYLVDVIKQNNGVPVMWKTGHSLMKAKMRETGALFGGEGSGHIYIKERWNGFDDAIYAAARVLELLAKDTRSSAEVFAGFPEGVSSEEINIPIPDRVKFKLIDALSKKVDFDGANINTIDGIRAEYEQGWFLIRASNTTPSVVVKFEADNDIALDRLKSILKTQLGVVAPKLKVNF
ncbi:MAG: phosphomannomutase/phosphoglucomutase [Kangiellaceae bacterium]|nr:phosphomannomutase/phosphoglucomutase [Kangiellaceae bacterium]